MTELWGTTLISGNCHWFLLWVMMWLNLQGAKCIHVICTFVNKIMYGTCYSVTKEEHWFSKYDLSKMYMYSYPKSRCTSLQSNKIYRYPLLFQIYCTLDTISLQATRGSSVWFSECYIKTLTLKLWKTLDPLLAPYLMGWPLFIDIKVVQQLFRNF